MSDPKTPTEAQDLRVINHFGVSVADLDRSVAYYAALTGTEPIDTGTWESDGLGRAVGSDHARIHFATFRLQHVNIDLLEVQEPEPGEADYKIAQRGAMHICFEVPNLAAAYERMEAAGIAFLGPWHEVTEAEDGARVGAGNKVAYWTGPDGEFLELIQPAGPFVRTEKL